jgi:capsular exopolysaccharide synthesis family protein
MTNKNSFIQQPIDFGRLLKPMLRYWYITALFMVISVLLALMYLRRATPVYEMQTTILIRNNEEAGLTKDALQKELLGMGSKPRVYEDVRIFRSRLLLEAIIDSLNLQYHLMKQGPLGERDVYEDSPIDLNSLRGPNLTKDYDLKILNQSTYSIQLTEEDRLRGNFDVPLNTEDGTFFLSLREEAVNNIDTAADYVLKTSSLEDCVQAYQGAFKVAYDSEEPTILDLYVYDEVQQRGLDVLKSAVQNYNQITLDDKSRNRRNTLSFIEERIDMLVTELNQVELDLQQYKTTESLTVDYKTDLPYIQERIGYFERDIVNAEIQQSIMQYISEALDSNQYQFFPLVDFGLDHKALSDLIIQYNGLIQERSRLRTTVTENYPSVQLVDQKIEALKISIQEEVAKNLQDLEARISELKNKNEAYLAELKATPRRERELVNKQRQQITKENLYKYLLEKREEAAVSIAAVGENAGMVDPPFVNGQVFPRSSSILLGAVLAGMFLPFSIILLFTLMDKRVRYKEEMIDLVDIPVLGSIVSARKKENLVIQADNHSPTAESFRSLRTNLDFFLNEQSKQLVVVTSTSIEEGKSFTVVNLGMSYALSGKRVLLIDFDLRNPKVARYLGSKDQTLGVSDYLTGEVGISDIIYTSAQNQHLDYIAGGTIPANPSELLMSDRLSTLLEELKSQYDIVILDTPAVGLVSDVLRFSRFADASLYLIRVGKTKKEDLDILNSLKEEGKISRPAIVINGVNKNPIYKKALKKGYYQSIN